MIPYKRTSLPTFRRTYRINLRGMGTLKLKATRQHNQILRFGHMMASGRHSLYWSIVVSVHDQVSGSVFFFFSFCLVSLKLLLFIFSTHLRETFIIDLWLCTNRVLENYLDLLFSVLCCKLLLSTDLSSASAKDTFWLSWVQCSPLELQWNT